MFKVFYAHTLATIKDFARSKEFELREGQADCILKLLSGESVLLGLPTGGGKSLVYQLYDMLKETKGVIVFAAPLTTILQEQARNSSQLGVCVKDLNM